jgi:hypothetical protein
MAPEIGTTRIELPRNVDKARYRAKAEERDRYMIFAWERLSPPPPAGDVIGGSRDSPMAGDGP